MNNQCPKCGTAYAMTADDVGRRIVCKKCESILQIKEDGFRCESASDIPVVVPEPPTTNSPRQNAGPVLRNDREWFSRPIDIPTILFGIGAAFVLFFTFMPAIGVAHNERRQAVLEETQFDHNKEVRTLREKPGNEEKIRVIEERWNKSRQELQDDVTAARLYNQQTIYRERYGMLLGFLLTMIGSLGMMRSEAGLVKRIFGAFVLAMQMLLVFNALVGGGCGASKSSIISKLD